MFESGEEDWWRRYPGAIANLCGNEIDCQQYQEIRDSQIYAALFDEIHSGRGIGTFFPKNVNYAGFKQTCSENPAVREACVNKYRPNNLNRLVKQIEKDVA